MRRILTMILLAAAVLTAADAAMAQRYRDRYERPRRIEGRAVGTVHIGMSSPTGDLGDVFDSGLGFGASIGYGISESVILSLGLSHHSFDHETFSDEKVTITPGTFNADYVFGSRSLMPWVGGGIGIYNVNDQIEGFPDEDESSFGFNLGAGVAGAIGRRTLIGGGFRYHSVSGDELPDSEFVTFQVGLGFFL
jgi:opacity protein-like surface antigen